MDGWMDGIPIQSAPYPREEDVGGAAVPGGVRYPKGTAHGSQQGLGGMSCMDDPTWPASEEAGRGEWGAIDKDTIHPRTCV